MYIYTNISKASHEPTYIARSSMPVWWVFQFAHSQLENSNCTFYALQMRTLRFDLHIESLNKAKTQSECIKNQQIENWASADEDTHTHTHTQLESCHTHTSTHTATHTCRYIHSRLSELSKLHGSCQLELNLIKSFMSACLLKIDKWQFFWCSHQANPNPSLNADSNPYPIKLDSVIVRGGWWMGGELRQREINFSSDDSWNWSRDYDWNWIEFFQLSLYLFLLLLLLCLFGLPLFVCVGFSSLTNYLIKGAIGCHLGDADFNINKRSIQLFE